MAKFVVPGLEKSDGEVGFKDFVAGHYQFRLVDIEDKTTDKHEDEGRQWLNAKMICEACIDASISEKEKKAYIGQTYFHSIFLLEEGHEWRRIGVDGLKNMLNAFGVKVGKDGNFNIGAGAVKRAVAKMKVKQGKEYKNAAGETVTPEPRAEATEFFAVEEDE